MQVAYHSFNVQSDGEDEREVMVSGEDGGEGGDEAEGQMHSEEVCVCVCVCVSKEQCEGYVEFSPSV